MFLCPGSHIQTQDLRIFNSYLSFSISSCLDNLNKPGEKSRSRLVYGGNFIASEKLVKREEDYSKVRQNRNDFFKPTFPPKK